MSITQLNFLLKKSILSLKEAEQIFLFYKKENKNISELNKYKILLRLLSKIPYGKLRDDINYAININLCKYPEIKLKYEHIMRKKQNYKYKPYISYWFPLNNIDFQYLTYLKNLNLCTLSRELKNNISEKNLDLLLFIYFIRGDYHILQMALFRLLDKKQFQFFNILFFIEKQAQIATVNSSIKNFYLNTSIENAFRDFTADFNSSVHLKHFYYSFGHLRHRAYSIFSDVKYLRLDLEKNISAYFKKDYAYIDVIFLNKENLKINFYFVKTGKIFSMSSDIIKEYELLLNQNEYYLQNEIYDRREIEHKISIIFKRKLIKLKLCDDVILIIDNNIYYFPFEELSIFENCQVIRSSSIDCLLINNDPFVFRKNNLKILLDESDNLKSTAKKFSSYFKRKNIKNENPNSLIYIGHGLPAEEKSYEIEILFGCKSALPKKVNNFNAYFSRSLKNTKLQIGLLGSATDCDLNKFTFSFLSDIFTSCNFFKAKKRAQKKCEYFYLTGALVAIHGNNSFFAT